VETTGIGASEVVLLTHFFFFFFGTLLDNYSELVSSRKAVRLSKSISFGF